MKKTCIECGKEHHISKLRHRLRSLNGRCSPCRARYKARRRYRRKASLARANRKYREKSLIARQVAVGKLRDISHANYLAAAKRIHFTDYSSRSELVELSAFANYYKEIRDTIDVDLSLGILKTPHQYAFNGPLLRKYSLQKEKRVNDKVKLSDPYYDEAEAVFTPPKSKAQGSNDGPFNIEVEETKDGDKQHAVVTVRGIESSGTSS